MGHASELTGGGLIRNLGGWFEVVSMRKKGGQVKADQRILGTGDFVNAVLKDFEGRHLRQLRIRNSGKTVASILKEEYTSHGVSPTELASGSRRNKVSHARAVIALRRVRERGTPAAEIARYVGVNTSSVSRAVARMEEIDKS